MGCESKRRILFIQTTSPKKAYIGMMEPRKKPPDGQGEQTIKNNRHFWGAIRKYGWDNFFSRNLDVWEGCRGTLRKKKRDRLN